MSDEPLLVFNPDRDIWEPADTAAQLATYQAQGAKFLRWNLGSSMRGSCAVCDQNDGQVRPVGQAFPTGHSCPQVHPHCACWLDLLDGNMQVIGTSKAPTISVT